MRVVSFFGYTQSRRLNICINTHNAKSLFHMSNTEQLKQFVHIVRAGSLSAAAQQLRLPKSSLSRNLKQLETELQISLLIRNTRSMRLTPEGEQLFGQISAAFEQIDQSVQALAGTVGRVQGMLRVSLPMALGREIIVPSLHEFTGDHPNLQIDIRFAPQGSNLVRDGIDLSIEVGPLADSGLVAKPLIDVEQWLVCHPKRGSDQFEQIDWVDSRHAQSGLTIHRTDTSQVLDLSRSHILNDPLSIRSMITEQPNDWVAVLPDLYCRQLVSAGQLKRLAGDTQIRPYSPLYFVGPVSSFRLPKVSAFVSFVKRIVAHRALVSAEVRSDL